MILGLLSKVIAAVEDFIATLLRAGLVLNPSESAVYIPSWLALSRLNLTNIPGVSADEAGCLYLNMTPGSSFPLKLEGITDLGCPIGTDTFCTHHIQKVVGTVERDLACLRECPFFHQRIKLAVYCCNTRPTYLL